MADEKKKLDWKDSNIALLGSATDRLAKLKAAKTEDKWEGVLKNEDDKLFIWRINRFKLEAVDKNDFGNFFSGDSYIVLKVKKIDDKLTYNVHFWIGESSTADEYGTAAYKTVELDSLLNDAAIQHREIQGYESSLFRSYFNNITYLKGGYDTGFVRVTPNAFKPRLFRFKHENKKHIIDEVLLSRKSISNHDVFIYDNGTEATQFNGAEANKDEKFEAAQFCRRLVSKRNGKLKVNTIDEGDEDSKKFLDSLPDVKVSERLAKIIAQQKFVYKLSDHDGSLDFEQVSDGSCPRSALDEEDVYVISGGSECFIYIGNKCSIDERSNAFIHAQNLLNKLGCSFIPMTMVSKGKTTDTFEKTLE